MSNSERQIKKLVKEHQKWLQETAPGLLERAVRRLNDNLSEASLPSPPFYRLIVKPIRPMLRDKRSGQLVAQESNAWDDIYLGAAFHLHQLRLKFALWTRLADEPNPTLPKVACALCFALANGMTQWARLLSDILGQAEWNDQMVPRVYWDERKFEPFALRLAQIDVSNGANMPKTSDSWGVYSDLLANWNSPELFAQALEAACDYHCKNMEDKSNDWEPEFDDSPFDLIPWEILAIYQVRNRLGLATPDIKHPLLAHVANFVPRNELPVDQRIIAVEQLRESLSMTVKV